jgi:hypothetical protein
MQEAQPGMLESHENLVNAPTKGNPIGVLLWTDKSLEKS